jgi:3-dehydroquinate dehydratase
MTQAAAFSQFESQMVQAIQGALEECLGVALIESSPYTPDTIAYHIWEAILCSAKCEVECLNAKERFRSCKCTL